MWKYSTEYKMPLSISALSCALTIGKVTCPCWVNSLFICMAVSSVIMYAVIQQILSIYIEPRTVISAEDTRENKTDSVFMS
jgi:hypothetical protein